MAVKWEEAYNRIAEIKSGAWGWHMGGKVLCVPYDEFCEITDAALAALRPVSREQVEKVWRGEWERITDPYGHLEGFLCKCGTQTYCVMGPCPEQKLSNADRIRSMSDEELADWAINKAPSIGKNYTDSRLGLLDWLQQPAEEDT